MHMDGSQHHITASRTFLWGFPLELWRAIFELVSNKRDLSQIAATCRIFQQEAEAVLYRIIELESSAAISTLSSALDSQPRRAIAVRALTIRRLDIEQAQLLNVILKSLVALKSLHIQPSYKPELVLAGCTFQLSQFTTLFGPDSRAFHPFLASQTSLQDLDIGNLCRIFSASRHGLLPRLRKLRASQDAIAQLSVDQVHNITHLAISVSTSSQVREILRLFGPQLVSLSISKPSGINSEELTEFAPSAVPRLVFLEFIEKKLRVSFNLTYSGPPLSGSPIFLLTDKLFDGIRTP